MPANAPMPLVQKSVRNWSGDGASVVLRDSGLDRPATDDEGREERTMKEDFNFTIVFVCPSRSGGGSKKSKRSESCHNIAVHLPPSSLPLLILPLLSSPKCRIQVTATERGRRRSALTLSMPEMTVSFPSGHPANERPPSPLARLR